MNNKFGRFNGLLIILTFLISLCAFTMHRRVINPGSIHHHKENYQATAYPNFLVVSDMHVHSGMAQDCKNDDSGDDLWAAAKTKISSLLSVAGDAKPKFLIVTGDLPYHVKDDLRDTSEVRQSLKATYNDLAALSSAAKVPLIIVPGNNDSYKWDYLPLNPQPWFKLFLAGSTGAVADQSNIGKGFYSVYPMGKKEKLRVIVMNTVIFSAKNNKYFTYGPQKQADATLQLNWLKQQLADVNKKDELALIAMHIPPGKDGYSGGYMWDTKLQYQGRTLQNAFLDITDSAKNNIVGLLASHTHMDGIRILSKDSTSLSSFLISIPGIAPGHRNNPSIKMISFNPQKRFELEGFTTYYMKYWNGGSNCLLGAFDKQFTFQGEFHARPGSSMLQTLSYLYKSDKQGLYNAVDSIYSVKNGAPTSVHNNAQVTITITKQ